MYKFLTISAGVGLALAPQAFAQAPCHGSMLSGVVRDSTLALIPGATVKLDEARSIISGPDGRFEFLCVAAGSHRLDASAPGFAGESLPLNAPHPSNLSLTLRPQEVETHIDVDAEGPPGSSPNATGAAQSLSGKQLQSLADDPDDLQRELQQLGAAAGGNPANTTIAVDGFQGSSKLPPKSSIAYIKVNPDQFSAEYREPPFEGGRVEVYTKPGQAAFHGALYAINGSPWMNARDPFSTSRAALGKQRYGFELTGPVRHTGSDFSLNFEHRGIDNFAVVNAVTLSKGVQVNTLANVATPQSLWIGQARLDWQLGAKNTFIASYSANVNHLENVGVGATSLAETGYDARPYEHVLRFTDVTTVSSHLMHEARLSLRWDGETDTPTSTAPQVQVAGAFTGGGASLGARQLHELNIEADDDAILTTRNHTFKFGTQMQLYLEHQQLTTNFNGTYTFGGGTAPVLGAAGNPVAGQTETITGIEQYRRAQLGLAGGTPTAFSNVAGTPQVDFTQISNALFAQDDWNVGHGVHIAYGVRYYVQNDPTTLNSATPRLGILWSPTSKGTWTLHAHAGLFASTYGPGNYAEIRRMDGIARVTSTVYNPVYGDPFAGATPIHSARIVQPGLAQVSFAIENVGGTRTLPHGWNLSADYYIGRLWNEARTENINSPLNGSPTGPRPGVQSLNLFQVQNSGQGRVSAEFVGVEQHTLKHVQFFVGAVHINLIDDADDNLFFTPQSAFSDAGEFAPRTGQGSWQVFGNGAVHLPRKIDLSADFNGQGDSHYNITTGFDNNGDGDFNDRPQYATPGTPGAIATRFGPLTPSGGTGVFSRNKGVLPWSYYLDANLQRAFALSRNPKAEHQQTVTVNVRSSNLLNHSNVTQVGGVLGSPLFGVPYAADNGRRIEAGLRYSF